MNNFVQPSYIVGRIRDSVRTAYNPNSGSALDNKPYALAESLLEVPNVSELAAKNIVLAIHPPAFTGYRSSSHYPADTFYYKVGTSPTVPRHVIRLQRSSNLANTTDTWLPTDLPQDLLHILSIPKSVSIQGKTYYRGADYDLDSNTTPTGIKWLVGGSRPVVGTNYSILIEYSTQDYNEARLKAGLIELEMLPTLTTYNVEELFYRVEYLAIAPLSAAKKQSIATDPKVFDERNFQPFYQERWYVPIRLPYKQEQVVIELDGNGLLTRGTLQLQRLVWVYKPYKLELVVENLNTLTKQTFTIPNSVYLLSPEGIIWNSNSVLQPYVSSYLDNQSYKLYWYFFYQPAYSIGDVYRRRTRPGIYPSNPDFPFLWTGYPWYPFFYYF